MSNSPFARSVWQVVTQTNRQLGIPIPKAITEEVEQLARLGAAAAALRPGPAALAAAVVDALRHDRDPLTDANRAPPA